MRFITKFSFAAVLAVVAVGVDAKGGKVELAGPGFTAEVVGDAYGNDGQQALAGGYDGYSVKQFGGYDDFRYDFDDDDFGRRHDRCNRCGYNPCRCKRHRRHHRKTRTETRTEVRTRSEEHHHERCEPVEEPNAGRLRITAPQCGQNFSVCSWQSICWSGPELKNAGYESVLGFYVGGRSCHKQRVESPELAVQARDICDGNISDKNIIFLGTSKILDGGYLPFNIPYCLSNGYYQPVLVAIKREGCKCKYIVSVGPWIEFIRNEGGKIESPLKRV